MEVYLTRHARNRMRLYRVAAEDVEEAMSHPEQVQAGAFGAQHAWKRFRDRWLRVTFKDEGPRRIVLTVTPTRHGPGGPHAD